MPATAAAVARGRLERLGVPETPPSSTSVAAASSCRRRGPSRGRTRGIVSFIAAASKLSQWDNFDAAVPHEMGDAEIGDVSVPQPMNRAEERLGTHAQAWGGWKIFAGADQELLETSAAGSRPVPGISAASPLNRISAAGSARREITSRRPSAGRTAARDGGRALRRRLPAAPGSPASIRRAAGSRP